VTDEGPGGGPEDEGALPEGDGPAPGEAPPDAEASPRQKQAEATRRQLLDAACEVFEECGYQATTVRGITDRANTAHGTFYLYFRNKEDAFCQVIESVIVNEMADDGTALQRGVAGREALEASLGVFVRTYARHVGLWRALLEGMLQSPTIEELWLTLRRQRVLRVVDLITGLQRRGGVPGMDPLVAGHALSAMTEWFAFTHLALNEPPSGGVRPDAAVGTLADLWIRALYGQLPPSPSAPPPSAPSA